MSMLSYNSMFGEYISANIPAWEPKPSGINEALVPVFEPWSMDGEDPADERVPYIGVTTTGGTIPNPNAYLQATWPSTQTVRNTTTPPPSMFQPQLTVPSHSVQSWLWRWLSFPQVAACKQLQAEMAQVIMSIAFGGLGSPPNDLPVVPALELQALEKTRKFVPI